MRIGTTTRAAAALAAALWGAAALASAPAARAQGAAVVGVGWWTRQPAAGARNGGFQVANAPDGAYSEAALRVRVDSPSLTKAVLVLNEGGGLRQDSAAIQVCPTSSTWGQADPGSWDQAPQADCRRQAVKLDRNASQSTWSANVNGGGAATAEKTRVPPVVVK